MKRIAFSINHFLDKDKFSCLDINGFHLCEEDMNRLEQFLDILSQTAIPVYRGDKRVYKLYHEKDLYSLAKKIFVIGEKGDAFIDRALSEYCIINEKLFVRLSREHLGVIQSAISLIILEIQVLYSSSQLKINTRYGNKLWIAQNKSSRKSVIIIFHFYIL